MVMPQRIIPNLVHAWGFLMSEAPGRVSREQGILDGAALTTLAADAVPGLVLGMITATKKLAPLNLAANDGSQNAAAILGFRVYKRTTDKRMGYVARGPAEVRGLDLTWPAGITTNQKIGAIQQLAVLGIIVRI